MIRYKSKHLHDQLLRSCTNTKRKNMEWLNMYNTYMQLNMRRKWHICIRYARRHDRAVVAQQAPAKCRLQLLYGTWRFDARDHLHMLSYVFALSCGFGKYSLTGRALALENGTYARNTVVPEQYGGEAERSAMISNFGGCHRRAGALRMSRYTSRLQELWRSSAATKIHQSAMADDGLEFILDQHQMICGMELFHIAW